MKQGRRWPVLTRWKNWRSVMVYPEAGDVSALLRAEDADELRNKLVKLPPAVFVLQRLRIDPAVASSPLITSICDGAGLLIYFLVATAVLQL